MNNLADRADELVELTTYDINAANRDSAQLHRLQRKAELATEMITQEILQLQNDIKTLEARRDEILAPIESDMQFLRDRLIAYHRTSAEKTIKLPWVTLKRRQMPQDYDKDDDKILAWAQTSAPEFVKVAAPTVAWGELKKAIVVVGGKVILKDTGEAIPGLAPKKRFVKYDVEVL